ncbi:hypothetical protein GUJ93_ZPchr0009g2464 [Zizania palustris]|uniref:Acireductone dioxygenase (Fe(2+)-requiring) n=1 Tax=Zizania palustris TaxID=103762 RepID=A0A8J5V2J1_ZIZPA|nr:hypothetical protein GUJ93_ZPchr0009g2464 [Zizania palustris]KAG8048676.1 hypothetical protein GUJ93_ZPchr0009g2464 [Zizania palustris]
MGDRPSSGIGLACPFALTPVGAASSSSALTFAELRCVVGSSLAKFVPLFIPLKLSESEEELTKIRKERGYNYFDLIEICPEKLENYEKVKNFYREHIHADEEICYWLEASGYFHICDNDDKWIQIWIKEGDMIVLPARIYHRFIVDSDNYIKWRTKSC